MAQYYSQIHLIHIIAISISGLLFSIRAPFSIYGAMWPRLKKIRILVYLIDIILIIAAISLIIILPKTVFSNGWLHLKVALVITYIGFGFAAMNNKIKKPIRIIFLICALLLYFLIIGIAINHNPMGWFS